MSHASSGFTVYTDSKAETVARRCVKLPSAFAVWCDKAPLIIAGSAGQITGKAVVGIDFQIRDVRAMGLPRRLP